MFSKGLWDTASVLGSKLKGSFDYATSDKPLIEKDIYDKLREEYNKLKIDYEEKCQKFDSIIKGLNERKERQENATENEVKNYYEQLSDRFKRFIFGLYENKKDIQEEINLIFINPEDEKFEEKINKYGGKIIETELIKEIILGNKNTLEELLKTKMQNKNIEENGNINKNDNNKEEIEKEETEENKIEKKEENENIEDYLDKDKDKEKNKEGYSEKQNDNNSIELENIITKKDIEKLLIKIKEKKIALETEIDDYKSKIDSNEQKFLILQENIEKLQKNCRDFKNNEEGLQEMINKYEKDIIDKENKLNELKLEKEKNENIQNEKEININGYKANIDQLNITIKNLDEEINNYKKKIALYEEENKNLNIKILNFKNDIEILQTNSDEINNKNVQITELQQTVESLKSSYKMLEENKMAFEKEKNEEVEIYKNNILDLTAQISELNEEIKSNKNKVEIEQIYVQKINELEKQNSDYEKENLDIKEINNKLKKELEETKNKMIKELKENEFMIDKRVISSVLVSYFDVNCSEITKKNLLETLSSIMEYSNEDRVKMGLKPIHIGDNKDSGNEDNKLKSISDGLYNFIVNS